jgi:glycosyltransferase 2 family protein
MPADGARHPEVPLALASAAALVLSTAMARRIALHRSEQDAFRLVNDLPSALFPPVYVVMQGGSLAAVFVASAAISRVAGRRVATSAFAAGFLGWLGSKGIKRWVGRGRPSAHMTGVNQRGPADRGLGFPSGHSAVAFAMATAVTGSLPRPWGAVAWVAAPVVALGRLYVGAHLPLDVVGGAALGTFLGATARLIAREKPQLLR